MITFEDNVASIEVISIDSGARYTLGEFEHVGADASIDPSGVKLLVSTSDPDFRFPSATAGLAVFDLENQTLTSLPNASDCHSGSWSPDGVHVAAVCMVEDPDFGARQDVVAMSVSSGDRWPITGPSYSGEGYSSPVWSRDGNSIAYAVLPGGQVPDPKDGLYLVAGDCFSRPGSCPSSTTHAVVGPLGGPFGDVRWSPTDPQLAYIEDDSVVVYSPTLGEISRIEFPSAITSLAWSPSGDGLAVTTQPSTSSSTLYMAAFPQGERSLVTHLPEAYARFWLSIR